MSLPKEVELPRNVSIGMYLFGCGIAVFMMAAFTSMIFDFELDENKDYTQEQTDYVNLANSAGNIAYFIIPLAFVIIIIGCVIMTYPSNKNKDEPSRSAL